MSCRYFLSVQITDAWVLINVQIWKLLIEQLGLGKILLWILWITFQFDHCHISHRVPSKSVHIPGNGSTCITWSWEKIVSRVSDGGSWMDVMRKSKFLLQEVRESMLQGLNMKTARMLYLFMFWRGGGRGCSESLFCMEFLHQSHTSISLCAPSISLYGFWMEIYHCLVSDHSPPPPFLTNLIRTAHTCVVHDNQREIYGRGNHGCSTNKG